MAYQRDNEASNTMERSRRIKAIFAAVIIFACIVFVTWQAWPKPEPMIPPAEDPAARWTRAYGVVANEHGKNSGDAFYWATARITTEPTPDNQGIIVKGTVKSTADLALVKAELEKIQPAVPLDWQVKIAR